MYERYGKYDIRKGNCGLWFVWEGLRELEFGKERKRVIKNYKRVLSRKKKMNSLDCCEPTVLSLAHVEKAKCVMAQQNKKEKAMYYNEDMECCKTPDEKKQDYLFQRLDQVTDEKLTAARKTYSIDDDEAPGSPKEFVDRIKAGQFRFNLNVTDENGEWRIRPWSFRVSDGVVWRTQDADVKGYDEFAGKVYAARQPVQDTIKIGTPAEGLKALQDFESATIN